MSATPDPPGDGRGGRSEAVGARQVVILALGLGAAYLIALLLDRVSLGTFRDSPSPPGDPTLQDGDSSANGGR